MDIKNKAGFHDKILLLVFSSIVIGTITFSNAYGSATCPTNTEWDGNNCTGVIIEESINELNNSFQYKKSNTTPKQEIIIIEPESENHNNQLTIGLEIDEDITNTKIKQKIMHENKYQMTLTRENIYFDELKTWSVKKAEYELTKILNGKDIQNSDFGMNINEQIEFKERLERWEDPILQSQIINEKKEAEKLFLKLWGNFTNH